jgi:hypothetical protein
VHTVRCYDGSMSGLVLIIAALVFVAATVLILGLLRLLKRSSMRRAMRIPERGAPPRWSALYLEEVARIRARPRRLPRRSQGFHPWEATRRPDTQAETREH